MSTFESHVSNSNSHLWTTEHDQVSTGRVRYSPVSYAEYVKLTISPDLGHWMRPVLTGLMRREGRKTIAHRTHTTGHA